MSSEVYLAAMRHLAHAKEVIEYREADPSCLVSLVPVDPTDLPRILAEYPGVLPDRYLHSQSSEPAICAIHLLRQNGNPLLPRKMKIYLDVETGEVLRVFRSKG